MSKPKVSYTDYPAERERWFEFGSQRKRETIEEWAQEQGVEIE